MISHWSQITLLYEIVRNCHQRAHLRYGGHIEWPFQTLQILLCMGYQQLLLRHFLWLDNVILSDKLGLDKVVEDMLPLLRVKGMQLLELEEVNIVLGTVDNGPRPSDHWLLRLTGDLVFQSFAFLEEFNFPLPFDTEGRRKIIVTKLIKWKSKHEIFLVCLICLTSFNDLIFSSWDFSFALICAFNSHLHILADKT